MYCLSGGTGYTQVYSVPSPKAPAKITHSTRSFAFLGPEGVELQGPRRNVVIRYLYITTTERVICITFVCEVFKNSTIFRVAPGQNGPKGVVLNRASRSFGGGVPKIPNYLVPRGSKKLWRFLRPERAHVYQFFTFN